MKKKQSFYDKCQNYFENDRESIAFFFLGVGLTMFIVNVTAIINLMPFIHLLSNNIEYPLLSYYISLTSSIVLMAYSLYNIYFEV